MLRCRGKEYICALDYAVAIVGGKWKPRILLALDGDQPVRFGSLERELSDTSRKVLTQQLRELERDCVVVRKAYAEMPPRVEYSLSERGRQLMPLLHALWQWGSDHVDYLNGIADNPPDTSHK
jgi:DNA-binding HxlR family transcriptional regulator